MLQTLLLTLLGTITGTVTGLLPGIHPNTLLFLSLPLLLYLPIDIVLPLISATAITHSLLNHIPSILIGAPDSDTALSSLPGKQLLLEGKGITAALTGLESGLLATLAAGLLLIPATYLLPTLYPALQPVLPYLVSTLFLIPALTEDSIMSGFSVIIAAGLLGTITLNLPSINPSMGLFPLFTGMFGIATILPRTHQNIPEQQPGTTRTLPASKGSIIGTISGFIAGIVPGIGPSATISFFTPYISSREERIASIGGINTADAIISLMAVYIIGKARSGASIAVQKLTPIDTGQFLIMIGTSFIAAGIAYPIGRSLLHNGASLYNTLDKQRLSHSVIGFILIAVILTTGITGLGILLTATGIGLYCEHVQVRKSLCMACLIVPYLLHSFGLTL
ncbi:MAG: tripartite tricarboxylate transporter permease [Candidatus Nanohaloarchaea archaeon]|nr:tripartite tricarboxylate transporter permease [Candidatus Nanohaloarchaea archaeon]